jgi:hypothetical protein
VARDPAGYYLESVIGLMEALTEQRRENVRVCRRIAAELLPIVLIVAALGVLAGCTGAGTGTRGTTRSRAGTFDGPPRAIGGGSARAFVTLDGCGNPMVIGVRLSEAALSGLPAERPKDADGYEYVLTLPAEAANTGYDHVGIDWNPMGHIPAGVYSVPHFDFHFYLISREAREKITAVGEDLATAHKAPATEYLPAGYILPPGTEVARMGAHAIDPGAPEFNKQPFTKTFIYGFYDGRMIFVEPMVAKSYLDTKPNVTEAVKAPKAYSHRAYYPSRYSVRYDQDGGEYQVSLEGLVSR